MTTSERLGDATTYAASRDKHTRTELGEYGVLINGQWLKTDNAVEVRSAVSCAPGYFWFGI